jgi:proteasome assembly chaperone 3
MGLSFESNMDETTVTPPFPAPTKAAAASIAGITTDVTLMSFSDKILITITQQGRLAQWVLYLIPRR